MVLLKNTAKYYEYFQKNEYCLFIITLAQDMHKVKFYFTWNKNIEKVYGFYIIKLITSITIGTILYMFNEAMENIFYELTLDLR